MQWDGKFVLQKHTGNLFKVAGAADKAGLSKATVELSNVKNHRRPNFKWAMRVSKLKRPAGSGRPKSVHNTKFGN